MNETERLAGEFGLKSEHAKNIIALLDEGNTIPFIARYRKEMTGSCDDQVLREFAQRLAYLRNLSARREEIRAAIEGLGKLDDELAASLERAGTLAELEDLYRPYRPKRRTRATIAMERGLEGLADALLAQGSEAPAALAAPYVDADREVPAVQDALAGARDIIAERVSDDAQLRAELRRILRRDGRIVTAAAKEESSVYDMYYEYGEPVSKIPSHRILAINRGEREGFLKVALETPEGALENAACARFVKSGPCAGEVRDAAVDGVRRLAAPSVEREIRAELTERASTQAIAMFALNLKPLLLQPPVRGRVTMGLDPAYRTGCKIAVVDATGKLLDHTVVYPTPPQNRKEQAKRTLTELIERHNVECIAIGNGTASKESELFVAELIAGLDRKLSYMVVSEAGASVYSASKLAAAEYPQLDLTVRSAISIAHRLQDPLAELVKIDPKSIGVGQYQHDMPPAQLDAALDGVVEDCVNSVGVDLNTASPALLGHIAGLSAAVAQNVAAHRDEHGPFHSRDELKKVKKLGPKTFTQCAGFLRIPGGDNILDNTSVHPESYRAARALLKRCGYGLDDVAAGRLDGLGAAVREIGESALAAELGVGLPTLRDMVAELQKPGRDPRDELPPPLLRTDVMEMKDLLPGMELKGTVRNVIDFGVFVDIGVHQDGLVHISQICERYIRHPSEVLRVGEVVTVWVLSVDLDKKRISLTMKRPKGEQSHG
ncbi:Tex family protein [Feifania hominis]|uniref:RNA-binding transcriptional accessory protein n=1 Tax=Feifania hominis TaxID=2763660 RepID=A0A926HQH4_9FIRM|nr:Tex family protein [Feifania hominis]MBC8536342.1 RNA-binding transcriptional accessory protein [Feifania hominis]